MFIRSFAAAAAAALLASVTAHAETAMPFALDWKFEGPAAPYFVAVDKGYFSDADLSVEVSPGKGCLLYTSPSPRDS